MGNITRNPSGAADAVYDVIIVGGGVYGIMMTFEATLRGLKCLLLEKDDWGGATSFNSLRIIHGGFRYLQNMDLPRFYQSVGERRWFLRNFPDFTRPLPCLMPLYGNGLRRPHILGTGLLMNALLSCQRNSGIRADRHLPAGRILSPRKTQKIFSSVDTEGLRGGAVWYDAYVPDSQRLLMEILRFSCGHGATVLNYVEARQALKSRETVSGVKAKDHICGKFYEYHSGVVINTAGPWCREVAARFDRDYPPLFRSSLVWNILLNRKALSDHALAVAPKKRGGQTYFLVPWKGLIFAGTGHAPWHEKGRKPVLSRRQVQGFLDDLNMAIPDLYVSEAHILRIFPGLQPATAVGGTNLASREVFYDHSAYGGPAGLYSVSGVKFTTARLVVAKALNTIFPDNEAVESVIPFSEKRGSIADGRPYAPEDRAKWLPTLRSLIKTEAVQHLDDLVLRRTTLWETPEKTLKIAPLLCELFDWDPKRCSEETRRLRSALDINTVISSY